jgi:hypothetical protein
MGGAVLVGFHLIEVNFAALRCGLPGRFTARQAAADNGDLIFYGSQFRKTL